MDTPNISLLLVDDDEFFVNVVASQLSEEYGHTTTVATNGREAKELVANGTRHFDIILTDYDMPEMNGLEFLSWLHDTGNETPVVMLTAAGSEIVAVEAMKLGAYDYVRKEQLDLQHLGVVINGTHERRQFRIGRQMEEERALEISLNKLATDKVRDVLNAITPTLNNALANIHGEIESKGSEILLALPEGDRGKLKALLDHLQREAVSLETAIKGLLGLYRMLYAHHNEAAEIELLKQEFEDLKRQK